MIVGKHAVLEALQAEKPLDAIYISCEKPIAAYGKIGFLAKETGIVLKPVPACKLDQLAHGIRHQGVVAVEAAAAYVATEEILQSARQKGKPPFLLLSDGIQDPHNLGALIRTAECMGVDGMILPKRNNASLAPVISKTSAGAVAHMLFSRVSNLTNEIRKLQREGIWVYGADMGGTPVDEIDLHGPVALVIGSEGKGLHRLVSESCDQIISIPMSGKIQSLNASVAGSILLYEIAKQRESIEKER